MPPSESSFVTEIGRYQVIRPLGQGAMGRVYLAHDPVLDRDVAIKLLRDDLNISEEQRSALLERMRQEARASARVSHPNIVALYDMGELPESGLFLVFEYVEGPSLKEKIASGGVGPEAAARIAREVGSALSTAHGAGVLHRDIKPENIIAANTGSKVADFGIARVPDSTLTRDGGLLGTPAYSAPEAIAEGTFSSLSDQFSLAATLYEAISLHRAFPGDDAVSVATRISNEDPPPIAALCGLEPRADTVLARALSKNPKARFATCEEFGRALAEALESSPRLNLATLPDARHQGGAFTPRRAKPFRVALGGAAFGALIALAVVQLLSESRSKPPPAITDSSMPQRNALAQPPIGWLTKSEPGEQSPKATRERPTRKPAAPRSTLAREPAAPAPNTTNPDLPFPAAPTLAPRTDAGVPSTLLSDASVPGTPPAK